MDELAQWLRDHLMVLDEGEPETFEHIKECVCDLVDAAMQECDYAGTTDTLLEAERNLRQAFELRKGVGSANK